MSLAAVFLFWSKLNMEAAAVCLGQPVDLDGLAEAINGVWEW